MGEKFIIEIFIYLIYDCILKKKVIYFFKKIKEIIYNKCVFNIGDYKVCILRGKNLNLEEWVVNGNI